MKTIELVKIGFLFLMVPLLIGHGLWPGSGGSPNPPLFAEGEYRIKLLYDSVASGVLTIETGAGQETIILTDEISTPTSEIFPLSEGETFRVTGDSAQADVGFRDLILETQDKNLRLSSFVIADNSGVFFDATYQLRVADLKYIGDPDYSWGASMPTYIMSGGETGSESIELPGTISVFVNSVLVYEGNTGINSPILFDAAVGDRLKVTATDVVSSGSMSRLWLHAPDGLGLPLSYVVELSAGNQYSTTYEIP